MSSPLTLTVTVRFGFQAKHSGEILGKRVIESPGPFTSIHREMTEQVLLMTAWTKHLPEVFCDGGWEAGGS